MELELKILKEKVIDDEKKSGIGSLFDDEKSSFQHISLLKQKYQKMRRDYDRQIEELNKKKLAIVGDQFVLDSQINVMQAQNQKIQDQQADFNGSISKRHFELDRELKDVSKQRLDTENEVRQLDNEYGREGSENYENKMNIVKDGEFERLGNIRHTLEVKLLEELLVAKDVEIKDFEEKRGKVKADILAHKEYQDKLAEEANLRKDIEEMGVKLEMMQINVKELEDVTDMLASKKDELNEAKKSAEMKNEELKKEAATKEELAQKRIQTKLNRDKNVEVKELIAQEETAVQHNQELVAKHEDEKKKYETLLDEKLEIDEKLSISIKAFEETKEKIAGQELVIADFKAKIEAQTKVTDDLTQKIDEEKKVNRLEEERFRKLAQMNAALKAKLEFIESKYDFTTNVNHLNSDDFKSLMNTNEMVRLPSITNIGQQYNGRFP